MLHKWNHVVWILWGLTFFSIQHSLFTYGSSKLHASIFHSFFFFCSVVFHVMDVPVFVQPIEPTERHMDSFQFGVIMNKAAMNNCVQPRRFLSERI